MSKAEQAAAEWHAANCDTTGVDGSPCWCCCLTCPADNPDHADAMKALRAATAPATTGGTMGLDR